MKMGLYCRETNGVHKQARSNTSFLDTIRKPMTKDEKIDLSIIDAKDLKDIKSKKERADRVMQVIKENKLDKDKEFMEEINGLIEELLKE